MDASPRKRTARTAADLLEAGKIRADQSDLIDAVGERFAIAVTPSLLDLIDTPDDPVGRQFIPSPQELETAPEELADPIGDDAHSPVKGLVHRYPDRVLLMPLTHCPAYCRFCFRREVVGGADGALSSAELAAALDYVRAHAEVWEVILTGGDPLMLPPARLGPLLAEIAAIPHVEVIRIHSRVPVTDPRRVTPDMLAALKPGKAVWLAVHANHPAEFTPEVRIAVAALADGGIPLLGQTVLLKGINDEPGVMARLLRTLAANRIKPYYLHHADMAQGTAHFRTSVAEGQALMRALRGHVSGLCHPTYVLDIPGGHGKAPLTPDYYEEGMVEDWQGRRHPYAG